MVIVSLLTGVVGPLPNGRTPWLINGGDPNHLLTGMILQEGVLRPGGETFFGGICKETCFFKKVGVIFCLGIL